jgi:hypothetical protein
LLRVANLPVSGQVPVTRLIQSLPVGLPLVSGPHPDIQLTLSLRAGLLQKFGHSLRSRVKLRLKELIQPLRSSYRFGHRTRSSLLHMWNILFLRVFGRIHLSVGLFLPVFQFIQNIRLLFRCRQSSHQLPEELLHIRLQGLPVFQFIRSTRRRVM